MIGSGVFRAPGVVVGGDEGGEVLVGATVDDWFLEGAVEAFDDAVGFRFAEPGEAGVKPWQRALVWK